MAKLKTDYDTQAANFLGKTHATITVKFARQGKYLEGDKDERDIYSVSMTRGDRGFTFEFGQSVICSGRYWRDGYSTKGITQGREVKLMVNTPREHGTGRYAHPLSFGDWVPNKNFGIPSAYDILSCLTKYDPGDFENFCGDLGYDTDSRAAEKTYRAVKAEYGNLCMLFSGKELELMQKIQ